MIVGHGIDLQVISAIADAYEKKERFARNVLTENEWSVFRTLTDQRQRTYLAGRWAAKEAFAKAYGTGIVAGCSFQDLEILADDRGRPVFTKSPFKGRIHVSISHSGDFVQASVILEGDAYDS